MKLAISNIAWEACDDTRVYELMEKYGYSGLEIAPTRIFPKHPYHMLKEAEEWAEKLFANYGFCIPSMQSIWYGREEKLFGTGEEKQVLISYTKKAIDFAHVIDCKNLVFGCPVNRLFPQGAKQKTGVDFFKEAGDYAFSKGTVIGMEANPALYHTNYINTTQSAFQLIEEVSSPGFLLNLDVGTMVYNQEAIEILKGKVKKINHVHISEPGLKPVQERRLHRELAQLLMTEKYDGFVSVEMGKCNDLELIEKTLKYAGEIFGT